MTSPSSGSTLLSWFSWLHSLLSSLWRSLWRPSGVRRMVRRGVAVVALCVSEAPYYYTSIYSHTLSQNDARVLKAFSSPSWHPPPARHPSQTKVLSLSPTVRSTHLYLTFQKENVSQLTPYVAGSSWSSSWPWWCLWCWSWLYSSHWGGNRKGCRLVPHLLPRWNSNSVNTL